MLSNTLLKTASRIGGRAEVGSNNLQVNADVDRKRHVPVNQIYERFVVVGSKMCSCPKPMGVNNSKRSSSLTSRYKR